MIMATALVLALAQEATPKAATPAAIETDQDLERQRLVKEAERINLRNAIQEAREKKDDKEEKKLAADLVKVEEELVALDRKLDDRRREGAASWSKRPRLEGLALLTHWDNDLELKDSFGWGAALHLPDPIYFDYRRWEPRDELGNESASVQSYGMGLHWAVNPGTGSSVTFTFSTMAAIIHLENDAGGSDSDTGWLWNARPRWEWQFAAKARLGIGADIDVMRTDFNNERTHTFHSFSAQVALEFGL
jgi:hypothetical protein